MIPVATASRQSSLSRHADDWQQALRDALRDPLELLARLDLTDSALATQVLTDPTFRVLVPLPFLARMQKGDPNDPLLRQVLAIRAEQTETVGYVADPLQEADFSPVPGLLRKYQGRALLIATSVCAVHCRYCFRREFPYAEHRIDGASGELIIDALQRDPNVHEIILSGGDPLMLKDASLGTLIERLASVPHLRTLRIHTRLPIVIPARVTPALARILRATRLRSVVVLHANHPAEIDAEVRVAAARLSQAGSTLLNQSVLLAGVNDDATTLAQLSERLFSAGVLPYYLHLLDPVHGTAHFDVTEARGRYLIDALRSRLPGYLVPRLVRETPGANAKQVKAS